MSREEGVLVQRGKISRWNRKRATGIVESAADDQIWFGLDSLGGRNFDDIAIGDEVEVEYEFAQQDSHNLRAVAITWV
ncbi:hypothetical protein [Nocardia cyriacigeorgica]|uniref:hypothetical protein n=1 Tax=Nocardia cyriacigeorgica TaxID=135487 RepID=UPI001032BAE1|nr:hypothetical protein [Nocardia cyriacigeorgica]MBF6318485.1 hypothetical protein [Nocardia cyriacigeorgica]MBF6341967.1 hypothetical protein [Nocardia cyriacigeorgica]MBF6513074.1 hypothetical protein [Nocardia cyriacigeorgica]MBF6531215.1 hypothetical protein [Nocardia cyriacigeorgica]